MDHSEAVQLSQGSFPAAFPRKYDQIKLQAKKRIARLKATPTVTIRFHVQPRPGS